MRRLCSCSGFMGGVGLCYGMNVRVLMLPESVRSLCPDVRLRVRWAWCLHILSVL